MKDEGDEEVSVRRLSVFLVKFNVTVNKVVSELSVKAKDNRQNRTSYQYFTIAVSDLQRVASNARRVTFTLNASLNTLLPGYINPCILTFPTHYRCSCVAK